MYQEYQPTRCWRFYVYINYIGDPELDHIKLYQINEHRFLFLLI